MKGEREKEEEERENAHTFRNKFLLSPFILSVAKKWAKVAFFPTIDTGRIAG